MSQTSIPVDAATKDRLDRLKRDDETWDEFLDRIIPRAIDANGRSRAVYGTIEKLGDGGLIVHMTDKERNRVFRPPDILTIVESPRVSTGCRLHRFLRQYGCIIVARYVRILSAERSTVYKWCLERRARYMAQIS